MKSLSLIHAIVLLHEGERLSRKEGKGRFARNEENIARAQELVSQVLGRTLGEIARESDEISNIPNESVCEPP